MPKKRERESILVVDDAPDTLELLRRNLESQNYRVFLASSVQEAVVILESSAINLVITDLKMPEVSGLDLVRHIRENFGDTEVMMITGYPSIEGAVEAVKTGAEEYLPKPFTEEELLAAVKRTLERRKKRKTRKSLKKKSTESSHGIIGSSKAMKPVFRAIEKTAKTSATVLITGESGTGKELVARAIHYSSPRASAPFVPVNCGGIPEGLLESELFGFVKGAFTGATESRSGFFQTADGGTIFLDEISETSLSMQVKLLRVLEDKTVYMVGSRSPQEVDVRIIAATNKDLANLVKKGEFREDLFYRLNVLTLAIPPLREREDDILLLVEHYAEKFSREFDKLPVSFSDKTLEVLNNYYWPGNVRELQNVVQRLIVMAEGPSIGVPDLPSLMRFSALQGSGLDKTLAEVEVEHIQRVCASVDGNKTLAAKILGIDRKTLREKLKKIHESPAR
jgi:DNA-binding NtrC family response regulator